VLACWPLTTTLSIIPLSEATPRIVSLPPFKVDKPDNCLVLGIDGPIEGPDFQCRFGPVRFGVCQVGFAIESLFACVITRLNLDKTCIETSIPVRREGESSCNVNGTDGPVGVQVVDDAMPCLVLHARAGDGDLAALPSFSRRPIAASSRTN